MYTMFNFVKERVGKKGGKDGKVVLHNASSRFHGTDRRWGKVRCLHEFRFYYIKRKER